MSEQTIWHMVADLNEPKAEPFAVIRTDTSIRKGNGVEGTIVSLHWLREEAEAVAHDLDCADNVTADDWQKPVDDEGCLLCGGDCSSANPPVYDCPMRQRAIDTGSDLHQILGEALRKFR
jgi:hypothetical protein